MTQRLSSVVMWTLILTVLVLAAAGCARSGTPPTSSSTATSSRAAPSSLTPASSPIVASQTRTDPALAAAVRFEQRHCAWTWRTPLAVYLAALRSLATPAYGTQLATQTDPVAWRTEVVAGQQTVTCTVNTANRLVGAPSTSTSVYTRMNVSEQISSRIGNFSGGQRIVSWLVQRVPAGNGVGHWLVAGSYDGG